MLDMHLPDDCCGDALDEAIEEGIPAEVDTWTHDECGTVWKARDNGEVRYWEPQPLIEVL